MSKWINFQNFTIHFGFSKFQLQQKEASIFCFFVQNARVGGLVSASTIIVPEKFTSTDEARETNTHFLPIITK